MSTLLALIDKYLFSGVPSNAVYDLIKTAWGRANEQSWEELYVESFRQAVEDTATQLQQYAETEATVALSDADLLVVLHRDLHLDSSLLSFSALTDEQFASHLAGAMAQRSVLVVGGNTLSELDYSQLVRNLVHAARVKFKSAILADEKAFRKALLDECVETKRLSASTHTALSNLHAVLREVQSYLFDDFGIELRATLQVMQGDVQNIKSSVSDIKRILSETLPLESKSSETRQATVSAVMLAQEDSVPDLPARLIGRDEIVDRVERTLDVQRVLLQGFSGSGKTAIASTVAANHIRVLKRKVIWMGVGDAEGEVVLEALERCLFGQARILQEETTAKIKSIRELLSASKIGLLVLDDAANGMALNLVLKCVPSSVKVLVTSRSRYPTFRRIEIGALSRPNSMKLLEYYAAMDLVQDAMADALCATLGDLAFSLRIAGFALAVDEISPKQLLERISGAPHDLAVPGGFNEEGRESLAALLEASLERAPALVRDLFYSFGALFGCAGTSELIAIYSADIRSGMTMLATGALNGLSNKAKAALLFEAGRDPRPVVVGNEPGIQSVEEGLAILVRRGLANRFANPDGQATYYRLHDLAFSYARSKSDMGHFHKGLDACVIYCDRYGNAGDVSTLEPLLDNLVAASRWAVSVDRFVDMDAIVRCLTASTGLLFDKDLYTTAAELLTYAVRAARSFGQYQIAAEHLLRLSIAFRELGRLHDAIEAAQMARRTFVRMRDETGEGMALSELGTAYAGVGQYDEALKHHLEALTIFQGCGSKEMMGKEHDNLGLVYWLRGQYDEALHSYNEALRQFGESSSEAQSHGMLTNIGLLQDDMGNHDLAIEYHERALAIAGKKKVPSQLGGILANLATAYRHKGELRLALNYYTEALELIRQSAYKPYEGNILGDIGVVYMGMSQYPDALSYCEQALAIHEEIKDLRGKAIDLQNIGLIRYLGGEPKLAMEALGQAITIADSIGLSRLAADIRKAIDLVSTTTNQRLSKQLLSRGLSQLRSGNLDAAIALFSQAIDLDGHNYNAYNNRGVAYGRKGDCRAAIADYSSAIALCPPEMAVLYCNRANEYGESGDLDSAIADFDAALALNPAYEEALLYRGYAKLEKEDADGALKDLRQVLSLNPGNAKALSILQEAEDRQEH